MRSIRFLSIGFLLVLSGEIGAQNDSLLHIAESARTPDTLRAKVYGDLSFENRFANPEKAYEFALQSVRFAEKSTHAPAIAQAYNDLGIVYFDRSQYDSALICYEKSLVLRKQLKDLMGLGSLYNKIGIVYQSRGQLQEALNAQLESLRCYDSLDYHYGISYAYNNIAILFYNLGDYDKALTYNLLSRDIKMKLGDRDGLGGTFSNLGNIFLKRKDWRKALDHYHLSLQYIDTLKNLYYTASAFNNLGIVYESSGQPDSAIHFIGRAIAMRERSGDKKGMVSSLSALGNLYVKSLKQPERGLAYLKQSLDLAREINVLKDHVDVLMSLAAAYAEMGRYQEAFEHLADGKRLSDSLFNEDMARAVNELQIRYETERQAKQNLELQRDKVLQDQEIEKKGSQLKRLLVVLIILTLLIVLILVWTRSRENRRIQLLEQKRFRDILETEEKERARVARELHDGVSQLIVAAKMHVDSIDDSEQVKTARQLLTDSLDEVRNVSHNLMPGALLRLGLKEAILENTGRISEAGNVTVSTELRLEQKPAPEVSRALYRIYQECMSNMLKYSGATEIVVRLKDSGAGITLEMSDNGKGFDMADMDRSGGIGWDNIRFRVNLLGGTFKVESMEKTGTRLSVFIPSTVQS